MTLKFVPPKKKDLPRYASYGAGQMKTHTSIGAAKQSLANRCGAYYSHQTWREGFILELVDGEWYVRYHVTEGMRDDDLPWYVDAWEYTGPHSWYRSNYLYTEPTWDKDNYRKVRVNRSETKEDYAAWRVQVALEKHGIVD